MYSVLFCPIKKVFCLTFCVFLIKSKVAVRFHSSRFELVFQEDNRILYVYFREDPTDRESRNLQNVFPYPFSFPAVSILKVECDGVVCSLIELNVFSEGNRILNVSPLNDLKSCRA